MSKKSTVLVVEDEPIIRNFISDTLLEQGFNVLTSTNGKEALSLLKQKSKEISAVVLDWIMPVMSGIELLEVVKKDRRLRNIPIIIQTSKNQPEDMVEALDKNVFQFLKKPYSEDVLLSMVKRAVREHQSLMSILEESEKLLQTISRKTLAFIENQYSMIRLDLKTYRELSDFFLKSLHCKNHFELTELLLNLVTRFEFESARDDSEPEEYKKLRCSVQIRSENIVEMSDRGIKSTLDEMILNKCMDLGEVIEKGTFTAIPSKSSKIAILIRNTPKDEKEKGIAVKIITTLIEQFDARLEHFENQLKVQQKNQQLNLVVNNCANELAHINQTYQEMKEKQMELVEGMEKAVINDIEDLPEKHKKEIRRIIGEKVLKSMELYARDQITDQKFNLAILQLKDFIDNKPKEHENLKPAQLGGTSQDEVDAMLESFGF